MFWFIPLIIACGLGDESRVGAGSAHGIFMSAVDGKGLSVEQRLQKAIDTLNEYKSVARGKMAKDDPADKYIAEAKKGIEEEKARQEMLRQSQMDAEPTE